MSVVGGQMASPAVVRAGLAAARGEGDGKRDELGLRGVQLELDDTSSHSSPSLATETIVTPRLVPDASDSSLLGSSSSMSCSDVIPTRKDVRTWLRSMAGIYWDLFQTLLSIVACTLYVLDTYAVGIAKWPDWMMTGFFSVDYLVRFYAAANRCKYPFTKFAIIDLLTVAPVYAELFFDDGESSAEEAAFEGLAFLRFVRILRVMRIMRAFGALNNSMSPVGRQLAMLGLTVASIMFLTAGLVHLAESPTNEEWTFGTALWFMVVTISTVGYGDISPDTYEGKAIVAIMIMASVVIVPVQVDTLVKLMQLRSRFAAPFKSDIAAPHIMVIGNVKNASVLSDFLTEFFHPDRLIGLDEVSQHRRCVVFGPDEPPSDVQSLLLDPSFEYRVQYVRGSVTDEVAMVRAGAHEAEACFVLCDPHTTEPLEEDKRTLLRTMMVKNFRPDIQMFVHVLSPDFDELVKTSTGNTALNRDKTVCVDVLRAHLLARSTTVPGFSTLLINMLRSYSDPDPQEIEHNRWLEEYGKGCGREVYTVLAPRKLDGLCFVDAALAIYVAAKGDVIVWGVQDGDEAEPVQNLKAGPALSRRLSLNTANGIKARHNVAVSAHSGGEILLNPGRDYVIKEGQLLLITADDQQTALLLELDESYSQVQLPPKATTAARGFVRSSPRRAPSLREAARKREAEGRHRTWQEAADEVRAMATTTDALKRSTASFHASAARVGNPHVAQHMSAAVRNRLEAEEIEIEKARYAVLETRLMDRVDFRNHVVVVGGLAGLGPFMTMVGEETPVVVIHPLDDVTLSELEELVVEHANLFVIKGSATHPPSLVHAGMEHARACVIVSDRAHADDLDGGILDSELLFSYLSLETFRAKHPGAKDLSVLTATTSRTNLSVLNAKARAHIQAAAIAANPERQIPGLRRGNSMNGRRTTRSGGVSAGWSVAHREELRRRAERARKASKSPVIDFDDASLSLPFYAAGFGFAANTLHTLLAQAFYDSHVFRLASALMHDTDPEGRRATLSQVATPPEYVGREFRDVFTEMLTRTGIILVGLYRAAADLAQVHLHQKGVPDNMFPYVYAAPAPDARIRSGDRLFVLGRIAKLPASMSVYSLGSLSGLARTVEESIAESGAAGGGDGSAGESDEEVAVTKLEDEADVEGAVSRHPAKSAAADPADPADP